MLSQFQDVLNVYLFPFVIAVPIAVVLYLLVTRRDEPPPLPPRMAERVAPPAATPAPVAPAAVAPTAARAAFSPPQFAPTEPPPLTPAQRQAALPGVASHADAVAAALARRSDAGPMSTLEAAVLRAQPPLVAPAAPTEANTTLLLVDDSAVARAKLKKLFETAGYPVALAKDGIEALELLSKNRYALMITDLEMPNMDGVELIAAVHGSLETEELPILAITGHDDLQAKVHECEGLFGIFKKPWNDRDLLRRVETLVRLQTQPGTSPA